MREFRKSIDIPAPAARVWAVMSDVERWPEWTASVKRVHRLEFGPLRVGSKTRIYQPKVLPAVWQVTEFDSRGMSFTWVSSAPGVLVTARHYVERIGQGSRATLSLYFAGPLGGVFGRLLGGLNERYLKMEAEGLAARAEALG